MRKNVLDYMRCIAYAFTKPSCLDKVYTDAFLYNTYDHDAPANSFHILDNAVISHINQENVSGMQESLFRTRFDQKLNGQNAYLSRHGTW